MVTENADLQQRLQSSEREREAVRQQLTRKEAELIREQQQIQEMRQQVCMCMYMYMYICENTPSCVCGYSSGQCVCLHNGHIRRLSVLGRRVNYSGRFNT